MSAKLNLGGNMPNSTNGNGLLAMADDLAEDSKQTITAIVEIEVNYLKVDPRSKDVEQVVLQITHIEPVPEGSDEFEYVADTLNTLFTKRTNEKHRDKGHSDTPLDMSGLDPNPSQVEYTKPEAIEAREETTSDAVDEEIDPFDAAAPGNVTSIKK